jgi:hypothetical protein
MFGDLEYKLQRLTDMTEQLIDSITLLIVAMESIKKALDVREGKPNG